MTRKHVSTGLKFIGVCVGVGLVLALLTYFAVSLFRLAATQPTAFDDGLPPMNEAELVAANREPPVAELPPTDPALDQPIGGLSEGGGAPVGTKSVSDSGFSVTDSDGQTYFVQTRSNDVLLSRSGLAIRLDFECGAESPTLGRGEWHWANGGFEISFGSSQIVFPRQEPPMPEGIDIYDCRF